MTLKKVLARHNEGNFNFSKKLDQKREPGILGIEQLKGLNKP